MAIEIVVGIGVAALLLGLLIGYFIPSGGAKKARVTELETALESAQEELSEYKREVFGQFAETAEKFRALDQSYHELHRQLAESSVALCGDAATPLLAGPMLAPETEALVGEASLESETEAETEAEVEADAEGETEAKKSPTQQNTEQPEVPGNVQTEPGLSKEEIVVSEAGLAEEGVDEADIVPTLTDVDAEDAKLASAQSGQEKKPAEGDVDIDQDHKRASA